MYSIIGCIIGIILYNLIIKPIEVRKNRQWCIDHGLAPSDKVNHEHRKAEQDQD